MAWDGFPFVRIFIPFAMGVVAEAQLRLHLDWLGWVCLSLFILVLVWHSVYTYRKKVLRSASFGLIVNVGLLLTGFFICQSSIESYRPNHYTELKSDNLGYICRLSESPIEKVKSLKVELDIIGLLDGKRSTEHHGKLLSYIQKDSLSLNLEAGQTIIFRAPPNEVSSTLNPREFDYKKYLFGKGIYKQVYLQTDQWIVINDGKRDGLTALFESWRTYFLAQLKSHQLSSQSYGVIAALVLGKKDDLDRDVFESYASAGAMHVLAVSGLHVGLIYFLVMMLTKPFSKLRKFQHIRLGLILLVLWCYAFITGMSASVLRAATMFSFIAFATTFGKKSNIYNTLAMSALVLILLHPFIIMEVGFQLSYCAVLGIVYFQPRIYRLFAPKTWLGDKLWALTAVSFSAQLATFPLGMLYFHQFPNYFLVSNLFVIPAASLILYLGLAFIAFHWFEPMAQLLANALETVVSLLNGAIASMENLPYPRTTGISITVWETYLIYAFILSLAFIFIYKKPRWIASLGLVSLLSLSTLGHSHWAALHRDEIVIHNVPGYLAISICHDETLHVIHSGDLDKQEGKIRFHLQNYWDGRKASNPIWHNIDSLDNGHNKLNNQIWLSNGLLISPKHKIRLVNQRWQDGCWNDESTTAIIVFGKQYKGVYEDLKRCNGEVMWMGARVRRKTRERILALQGLHTGLVLSGDIEGALVLN